MLQSTQMRLVNPRLGIFFGVYASLLLAAVLVALLLEQLGVSDGLLRGLMFAVPVLLFSTFGLAAATKDPFDFFVAGRRVPPFFSGLVLSVSALGSVGIVALTGALFMMGTDAFALMLGWPAGLVVMAVLIVPFLRKFGAYSVPGYFGQRFDSRVLRVVAAAILAVPVLLLLVAEIRMAAAISAWLTGQPEKSMAIVLTAVLAISLSAGGMRSLTWSSAAKAIALVAAVVVPATIVSVSISNLPIPQMTAGNLTRNIFQSEVMRNVPVVLAGSWVFDMPGVGLEPLGRRFLQMFSAIGPLAFSATIFTVMAGIAASPGLLTRLGTTPSVYAARKSMGWAVVVTAFLLLTCVASAVFLRGYITDAVVGVPAERLPAWFKALQASGIASINASARAAAELPGIAFRRDGVLFALPVAAGLPAVLQYLTIAGALAAAMAAMGAQLMTLGTSIAEDVVLGVEAQTAADDVHVLAGRIGVLAAAAAGVTVSFIAADPLELLLWSLTLSASACFPVLVLSIVWKRLNSWGALCGMLTGFAVAVVLIVMERMGLSSLSGPLPAVIAMPLATGVAMAVPFFTPQVSKPALELLRDMRVPGGETLVDRQMRIAKMKAGR